MYTDVIKVIDILLRYLDGYDIDDLIYEYFSFMDEFRYSRINLINLVSINSILSLNPNFSADDYKRIIDGILVKSTDGMSAKEIYDKIIEGLEHGNYSFDGYNNVCIEMDGFGAVVSTVWLCSLVEEAKKKTFLRVFLFNNKEDMLLKDENELLYYLYHTKFFLVGLNGEDKQLPTIYDRAVNNTKGYLFGRDSIKSADIKEVFLRNIISGIKCRITECHFDNYNRIVEKARRKDFYTRSLREQKNCLSKWVLEAEAISVESNMELNRLALLVTESGFEKEKKQIDSSKCYSGLFELFMYVISMSSIDYDDLYLSKLKIKNHVDSELVKVYNSLKKVTRIIGLLSRGQYEKRLKTLAAIDKCNEQRNKADNIAVFPSYGRVKKHIDEYVESERKIAELCAEKNDFLQRIQYEKEAAPIDLAFDNNTIMSLIGLAIRTGRIYINENNNTLVVELNDHDMGMNVFRAAISIRDLEVLVSYAIDTLEEKYELTMAA